MLRMQIFMELNVLNTGKTRCDKFTLFLYASGGHSKALGGPDLARGPPIEQPCGLALNCKANPKAILAITLAG